MLREIDINSISDGKLYGSNDMVKADCQGCNGCSACCHGMGTSIILDPLDIYRLTTGLTKTFQELMASSIELNVADGIILPNLKMSGPKEACSFLDENGRCSIHSYRPGICRLFPLGRLYEEDSFRYFLQVQECPNPHKTKVKIRKWIDTPQIQKYETFVNDWHRYLKGIQMQIAASPKEDRAKELCMEVLRIFYVMPYRKDQDFYEQFYQRMG